MRPYTLKCLFVFFYLSTTWCYAQNEITGTIIDLVTGQPIKSVVITNQNTNQSVKSTKKGEYSIEAEVGHTLKFSADRYFSEERIINSGENNISIELLLDVDNLKEVVLVGSRFKPRAIADSPVPIDNISDAELRSVGHYDLDMMMMYNIPAFNSSYQTVSDATAHMNPADLRGLGPSRTLILVNGKRKNSSALVYINDTPGKGEVGVDLTSIPISAIDRIEVLRDGASAQYGSDAIAGVINIVLKENREYAEINSQAGIFKEGDGAMTSFDANFGTNILTKGFVDISTSFKKQAYTDRSPDLYKDDLFNVDPSDPNVDPAVAQWIQENPDLGMVVGQPEMTTNNIFYNFKYTLNEYANLYSFGGSTLRKGKSFALFRTPYWVDDHGLFGSDGFQPDFQTDIQDNTLSFGLKGSKSGWDYDISSTRGSNDIAYTIGTTFNDSLKSTSPTRFKAGSYYFSQIANNFDISKSFKIFDLGFGLEFRTENFITRAGEESSYIGQGSISFPGIQPTNEVNEKRNNIGFYLNGETEFQNLLLGGAIRYEDYSDFGNRFNWKVNLKYDLFSSKLGIRGSASTGFRAPSLHQIYLSNIQTIVSGGSVSNQGTFQNNSTLLKALDIPQLKEETSLNISGGITVKPNSKMLFTADYYYIEVKDRIVFTGAIGEDNDPTSTTDIETILYDFNITSFKFFTNAIDTKTSGVDVVAMYENTRIGKGDLDITLGANYNSTKLIGPVRTSSIFETQGNQLFDRKEVSRIESARPATKVMLQLSYNIKNFGININNTHFGEVTWRHASDPSKDQTFSSKLLTDLCINYSLLENLSLSLGANNIFDIYPDKLDAKGDVVTNLGGRFEYPWDVNQFGFNGSFYFVKAQFRL